MPEVNPAARFGSLGETYRFLLQLPAAARVGLIGPHWGPYRDNFASSGLQVEDLGRGSPHTPLDAVFFDGTLRGLSRLPRGLISATSKALVVVRQRHIPADFVRSASSLAVQRLDLPIVADFTPVPDFENAEVFIAPGVDPSPWLMRRSLLRRILPRWNVRPITHLQFLGSSVDVTGFGVAPTLLAAASGDTGFVVERYHPRRWGPLILILISPQGTRRVLRVATNQYVVQRVLRNQRCTSALVANPRLPRALASLIPAALGSTDTTDGIRAFSEEFREGQLAWTLYRDEERRKRIDSGLLAFSHGMQLATRTDPELDSPANSIVTTVLPAAAVRDAAEPAVQRLFADLEATARARLASRPFPRCLAHGDFGVGNALADRLGNLTAIIDWDQQVENDLPGMDWCVHRLRGEHWRHGITQALNELVQAVDASGCLGPETGAFGADDFGLRKQDLRLIASLAALRSLTRSGRFTAQVRSKAPACRGILEGIARHLANQAETRG